MSTNTPIKDIRTMGVVLRRTNYGESDRILNVLTSEGKFTVIAKGVRKAKSKLAGGIEMFSLIDFNFHFGRSEMGVVTGAKMVSYYSEILKDFERMELAGMILKMTGRVAESSDSPDYFKIVKQCLECLNDGVGNTLIESWFLLNLYLAGGEEVNLYRDAKGEKLSADLKYNWDIANEAFLESDCGEYGADEIKLLRLMCTTDLKTMRRVKVSEEMYEKVLKIARAATHI